MNEVFLGIGSNLGEKEDNITRALELIRQNIGIIIASSSLYETAPWGFQSDNLFLNIAVKIATSLDPFGLLGKISETESQFGRIRGKNQYISRIIDIDILFYNDLVINEENLKIPHPLLHERKFVLVPLCEIAPGIVHPILKSDVQTLLLRCRDKGDVKLYK